MHTFEADNSNFLHNGDYSGNVEISDKTGNKVSVPFIDLQAFVANYVRTKLIEKLEQASDEEMLGVTL